MHKNGEYNKRSGSVRVRDALATTRWRGILHATHSTAQSEQWKSQTTRLYYLDVDWLAVWDPTQGLSHVGCLAMRGLEPITRRMGVRGVKFRPFKDRVTALASEAPPLMFRLQ
ncbi:hypothetical protein RRG08_033363 [Elysia crispata]|uniref:Uncharacterized protein n=1 Tax=Elysia crispata TaxID=231223 RepID=A0AAE1DBD1_9GAST|nr:hypothetical protein RRG08_033363 [Elysia crispata]